jgi:carboxymethylenebutenolidase
VERVRAAVQGAEVHVYAGATHGFNCWARASYHAASAALAHGRATAFLAQQLF